MKASITYDTNQQFGVYKEESYRITIQEQGDMVYLKFYFLNKALSQSRNALVTDVFIGFNKSEAEKITNALVKFLDDPTKNHETISWENKKESPSNETVRKFPKVVVIHKKSS